MKFKTRSGSTYEVDLERQRIRRFNEARSVARLGPDGDWKAYRSLSVVCPGDPVFITWPEGTPLQAGSPPWAVPSTITSPVVEVLA